MRRLCALLALTLVVIVPAAGGGPPAGVEVVRDVVYASPGGVPLHLDAYLVPGPGPHPAVVFIHGGAWHMGDKTMRITSVLLPHVTDAGFSVFSIDYRLAPQHPYPAAVDDVRSAVRFLQAHEGRFRIDGRRLALSGSSAGGHLASLVGGTFCDAAGGRQACSIRGVISFAGVADLRGRGQISAIRAFMGPRIDTEGARLLADASPITHVDPHDPPVLLVHGDRDRTVPYWQAERYYRALRSAGVTATLVTLPGGNHATNWDAISTPDWKREVVLFLNAHLRPRR